MQREIKFRAKNKSTNKWLYFTLEDLAHGRVFNEDRSENWSIREIGYENIGEQYQYIGLQDRKGVEIYDKDILRWYNKRTSRDDDLVEWSEYLPGFVLGRWIEYDHPETDKDSMVVGNAVDNPELIP